MKVMTVNAVLDEFGCDKGTKHPHAHGYGLAYARVFSTVTPTSLLEVGVQRGRSIAAWKKLFPEARLAGLDYTDVQNINDGYYGLFGRVPPLDTWELYRGDSTLKETADSIPGNFDIIIDDGSHRWQDQVNTFKNFIDKCNHIYVIEDIFGTRHERFIRNAVKEMGYTNIHTFDSRITDQVEYIQDQGKVEFTFKFMVIIKDANRQLAG